MDKRTELMLALVPVKMRARLGAIRILDWIGNKGEYWIVSAIDRLNIDKCHRYDDAVSFVQFMRDDDLFMFEEDAYDRLCEDYDKGLLEEYYEEDNDQF